VKEPLPSQLAEALGHTGRITARPPPQLTANALADASQVGERDRSPNVEANSAPISGQPKSAYTCNIGRCTVLEAT